MLASGLYERQPVFPPVPKRQRLSKPSYQRYKKPPYTYTGMIVMAIHNSPEKRLLLSQIHDALGKMFPFFRQSTYTGWKDSVRHNLSHNQCFTMILKDPSRKNGKGNFWTVDLSLVQPDVFKRQDTTVSREGRWAPDLHIQLGCPPVLIPSRQQSNIGALRPSERNTNVNVCRKRKLDDVTANPLVLPAEKRHQSFHIANILQSPPSQPQDDIGRFSSCAFTNAPPRFYPADPTYIPTTQLMTPEPADKRNPPSCPDDSGCYVSSSSASPEADLFSSRHIPPVPRFPPEDYALAIETSLWNYYYWPSFSALESAIYPAATSQIGTSIPSELEATSPNLSSKGCTTEVKKEEDTYTSHDDVMGLYLPVNVKAENI
ncbi:forkhead activin signal transducer 3-like [Liolophura sinensis]|uniref:forkhead activin signal transducer 3-like n=1 Tax=Liolophura sinensis TaxID=3198878 RepID=UPI003158A330